jgi:excisionase family DNA binding protein
VANRKTGPAPSTATAWPVLTKALTESLAGSDASTIASLLGDVERLRALAWEQLVRSVGQVSAPPPTNPVDDLRHITPLQVAELLNLKEAYVHELCRTGRLPAVKQGKYWLIPVAGVRRWVTSPNADVDDARIPPLQSLHPGVDGRDARRHPLRPTRRDR